VTGFYPHTENYASKKKVKAAWLRSLSGITASSEDRTLILFNLGKTSTGLDIKLYPKSDMEGVTISQAAGGQEPFSLGFYKETMN